MKILSWFAGMACALALIMVIVITSFEIVVYGGDDYFQEKYEKYNSDTATGIEMEELLRVSREMMKYLNGTRDDLVIMVEADGVTTEFFNQREKAHMEDVRALFLGGIKLRQMAAGVLLVGAAAIFFMQRSLKKGLLILAKTYLGISVLLLLMLGVLAFLMLNDFNGIFIAFHNIFFDNDLWILDPATDRMINMLPEGFFADTATEIGMTAAKILAAAFFTAVSALMVIRKKMID